MLGDFSWGHLGPQVSGWVPGEQFLASGPGSCQLTSVGLAQFKGFTERPHITFSDAQS